MSSIKKSVELEDELRHLGLTIIGKTPKRGSSVKQQDRLFRSHYGTGWAVAAFLWRLLEYYDGEKNVGQRKTRTMQKKHILWCLFFLKLYASEDVSAARMDCSPDTFRKWVWHVIKDIAFVEPFVVSI